MIIEVYLRGRRIKKQQFDLPEPDPALTFQQRFEDRERTVKRVVEDFKSNYMDTRQRESDLFEIVLVFESKMNPVEEVKIVPDPLPLPKPFKKREIKDTPRVYIPELEPVKWVRAKAEYSNVRGYEY